MDLERFTVKDMQRKSKLFLDLLDSGKEIYIRGITIHKMREKCPKLVYTTEFEEKNGSVKSHEQYIPPDEAVYTEEVYDERGDIIYGESCSTCGLLFKRDLWEVGFEDGDCVYGCEKCLRIKYGKYYDHSIKKLNKIL